MEQMEQNTEKLAENSCKDKIFTIPNLLSLVRMALIPLIVWLYIFKENYLWTIIVLGLSGLSDVVDGFVARRFNMTSDFGKAIDPVADKLTQIAVLFCLVFRFNYMIFPLVFLIIKEGVSAVTSYLSIKKANEVKSAEWHGKLTTLCVYSVIVAHLIWINIPELVSYISVAVAMVIMLISFVLYSVRNFRAIKNGKYD